jgi:hypothetical protein
MAGQRQRITIIMAKDRRIDVANFLPRQEKVHPTDAVFYLLRQEKCRPIDAAMEKDHRINEVTFLWKQQLRRSLNRNQIHHQRKRKTLTLMPP